MNTDRDSLDELIRESFAEEMLPPAGFQERLFEKMEAVDGRRGSRIPAACAAVIALVLLTGAAVLCQGVYSDQGRKDAVYQDARHPAGGKDMPQGREKDEEGNHHSDPSWRGTTEEGSHDSGQLEREVGEAGGGGSNQSGEKIGGVEGNSSERSWNTGQPASASPQGETPAKDGTGQEAYYEVAGVEDKTPMTPKVPQTAVPAAVKIPGGIVISGSEVALDTPTLRTAAPSQTTASMAPQATDFLDPGASDGIVCKVASFVLERRITPSETVPAASADVVLPVEETPSVIGTPSAEETASVEATLPIEETPSVEETASVEATLPVEGTPSAEETASVEATLPIEETPSVDGASSVEEITPAEGIPDMPTPGPIGGNGEERPTWNPSEGIRMLDSSAAWEELIQNLQKENMMQQYDMSACSGMAQRYDSRFFEEHTLCVMMTEEVPGSEFTFVEAKGEEGLLHITLQCHRGRGQTGKVLYMCIVEVEKDPDDSYGEFQLRMVY